MNALLYVPGYGFLLYRRYGLVKSLLHLPMAVGIQLAIGFPFLDSKEHTKAYFGRAFEFSRAFLYQWTVNWRFLSENVFLSKRFSSLLLAFQLAALVLFMQRMWSEGRGLVDFLKKHFRTAKPYEIGRQLPPKGK